MKTAITSTGKGFDSTLDDRFGRCAYFVIYDQATGGVEFIPNPQKDAEGGAGTAAVQFLASRNVDKIVSGEFGAKIKSLLDSLKIQMILLKKPGMTIQQIIELLNH